MGMVGCFVAVDAEKLRQLRTDPSLLEEFLYPEEDDEPQYSVDVDKAWHGIHFMLTGQADGGEGPLADAVMGGEELGDDQGYGPARFLSAEQVRAVAHALSQLSTEEFEKGFKPEAMTAAEVYPDVIWTRDGDEALQYVLENYQVMVSFYRDAAARGDGALLWLG